MSTVVKRARPTSNALGNSPEQELAAFKFSGRYKVCLQLLEVLFRNTVGKYTTLWYKKENLPTSMKLSNN